MSERSTSDENYDDASCRRRRSSLYAKTLNLLGLIGPPPAPALTFDRCEPRGVDELVESIAALAVHAAIVETTSTRRVPARRSGPDPWCDDTPQERRLLGVRILARKQPIRIGVIAPDPSPTITETPAHFSFEKRRGMNSLLCLDGVQGNDELLRRGTRSTCQVVADRERRFVPQSRRLRGCRGRPSNRCLVHHPGSTWTCCNRNVKRSRNPQPI